MICPHCAHPHTHVVNSRQRKKSSSIWRRRTCDACKRTFTTEEVISLHDVYSVISGSGSSQPYNRGVLLHSITQAFAHDAIKGADASWWLLQTIEQKLLDTVHENAKELTSTIIATETHAVLSRYDKAAGIQYAAQHGMQLS